MGYFITKKGNIVYCGAFSIGHENFIVALHKSLYCSLGPSQCACQTASCL